MVVKDCFRDSTVLTIAHRLDTVMDSDRICVIDAGSIIVSIRSKNTNRDFYGVELVLEMSREQKCSRTGMYMYMLGANAENGHWPF